MWRRIALTMGAAATSLTAVLASTTVVAAGSANEGVTTSTIRIGVPYIDFSSLAAQGVKLTQGNFKDAYSALIANMNAHGGINGRKIVSYYAPVNLSDGTVGVDAVCATLTEDHTIFIAMAPYEPTCYLVTHDTPTVNATFEGAAPSAGAPNFSLIPPSNAYDPLQISVYNKLGFFKGKKVGVVGGTTQDQTQVNADVAALKKVRVKVAQVAVNSAPAGDQNAAIAQDSAIVQKFQSAGVNEVVAVGGGSSAWPYGLAQLQSNYNPPWVAMEAQAVQGTLAGTTGQQKYLGTMTTSSPSPSTQQVWKDPLIQKCVSTIKRAFPSDTITAPSTSSNSNDHSFVSAESACQNLALFAAIAKPAGKKLTVASFTKAGYGLRNVTLPGAGGPVSFAPGQDYAIGPVFIGKYSATLNQIVYSSKSTS